MPNDEDWLKDPIKSSKLKRASANDKQNDLWHIFHFSTRLKLNGAEHFCRQVLGAASMPYDWGLPRLAYSQLKWYLDAFFFELMSAYDTLLQELNVVYAYDLGLEPKHVRWDAKESKLKGKFKDKLPKKLLEYMENELAKDWFKNVHRYRNMAAHHHYVPTDSLTMRSGRNPWDYHNPQTYIYYFDETGNQRTEEISNCETYLKNMGGHIQQVWKEMAQEFQ